MCWGLTLNIVRHWFLFLCTLFLCLFLHLGTVLGFGLAQRVHDGFLCTFLCLFLTSEVCLGLARKIIRHCFLFVGLFFTWEVCCGLALRSIRHFVNSALADQTIVFSLPCNNRLGGVFFRILYTWLSHLGSLPFREFWVAFPNGKPAVTESR